MPALSLLLVTLGCAPQPEPTLDRPLDEGDRAAATRFATALASDEPPGVVCSTHHTWLVHVAATTDDPALAAASLKGLAGCAEDWHEPDVRRALARWWDDPPIPIAAGLVAVSAGLVVAAEPDDPVVEGLVRLATEHDEVPVRLAALDQLDRRPWGRENRVASAFVDALLVERRPVLTATALHALRFEAPEVHFAVRPRLQAGATLALRDIDPGIRGRSARALARLAPHDPRVVTEIRALLLDEHPFTRAAAAKALADVGDETFVHDLVPLLDDHESTEWRSRPYLRLDGTSDRVRFVASPHERVDEAALIALERLTADLAEPYVIRSIDPTYADLDILSASREARAWYQAAYGEPEEAPAEEGGEEAVPLEGG